MGKTKPFGNSTARHYENQQGEVAAATVGVTQTSSSSSSSSSNYTPNASSLSLIAPWLSTRRRKKSGSKCSRNRTNDDQHGILIDLTNILPSSSRHHHHHHKHDRKCAAVQKSQSANKPSG